MPGWRSITLRLPAGASATFSIDQGNGGRPDKIAQLTLDRKTGAVVRWEPFTSFSLGQRDSSPVSIGNVLPALRRIAADVRGSLS